MRPAVLAALDQADAADADACRFMAAAAELAGTTVATADPAVAPLRKILVKLARRALAGELGHCDHALGGAPVHWSPWAPGRVRCAPCHIGAGRRIRGTVEDRRCDACGRLGRVIHPDALQLPAVVLDAGPGTGPITSPPVIVSFGLCRACHRLAVGG